jgi:gas vesicle protein
MHRRLLLPSLLAAAFCAASAFAAEPAGDAQAREKLRVATLQLRDAVAERDSAKSARDALTDENRKLAEQVAALQKQAVADGVALNRLKTDSANKLAERDDEVKRLQAALKEESEALAQLQQLARTREDARLRLVEEKLALANVLAEREGQNIELHRLAGEILRRYEQFGFGEALAAKEPFVGRTRAKLETLVQDYRDRLLAQRAPAKP